ncbi:MAG: hypothetical protein AAGA97_04170 [Pseudomonadota bacterium]
MAYLAKQIVGSGKNPGSYRANIAAENLPVYDWLAIDLNILAKII